MFVIKDENSVGSTVAVSWAMLDAMDFDDTINNEEDNNKLREICRVKYIENQKLKKENQKLQEENEELQEKLRRIIERKYDEKGNVIWTEDAGGRIHESKYDENNNLIWRKYPSGNVATWGYDENNNCIWHNDHNEGQACE